MPTACRQVDDRPASQVDGRTDALLLPQRRWLASNLQRCLHNLTVTVFGCFIFVCIMFCFCKLTPSIEVKICMKRERLKKKKVNKRNGKN